MMMWDGRGGRFVGLDAAHFEGVWDFQQMR